MTSKHCFDICNHTKFNYSIRSHYALFISLADITELNELYLVIN